MRLDRTAPRKNRTVELTRGESVPVMVLNPVVVPGECVWLDMGTDDDGYRYTAKLTRDEAKLLLDRLYQSVQRWE